MTFVITMANEKNKGDFLIGGMALLEGVMMKAPDHVGIAVRAPDGCVKTKSYPYRSYVQRHRWANIPFVRGVINMVEMMYLGLTSLNFSADIAIDEGEEKKGKSGSGFLMSLVTIVVGLGLALLLFKFLPFGAASLLNSFFAALNNGFVFNVAEGAIKITIFIVYLWLISLMPDIKRVFQYHGAEHKTVWCQEKKKKLTVRNVQACNRLHPRCGTSFIIFVLLLSILVYTLIPASLSFWEKFGWRILLLPVLTGISYEILRFSAKRQKSLLFRIISAPGLWTQRITTREPHDDQVEIAIKALKVSMR